MVLYFNLYRIKTVNFRLIQYDTFWEFKYGCKWECLLKSGGRGKWKTWMELFEANFIPTNRVRQ